MLELTPQQTAALHAEPGKVIFAVDPESNSHFAIVPSDKYESVRAIFDPDEEFDVREMYPLLDEAFRDIIDDPALDVYNQYLPRDEEPTK